MRPIDADEVRKHAFKMYQANGLALEPLMVVPLGVIDNAPTVPLPDFKEGYKQAILDGKTNYSRPEGEWKNVGFMTCECDKCKEQFHELEANNYCPNCGTYMKGGTKNEMSV